MRTRLLIATLILFTAVVPLATSAKTKAAPAPQPARVSSDGRPIVAVAEFKNETNAGWWSGGVGSDLAGLLSNELSNTGSFKVVEREKLQSVMEEQNLMASGRAKLSEAAQIGKLTGAQYLVTGTVTSFEANTGHSGGGFSFGGVSIGGKKSEAYVAIDIRVIDTTTGDVEYSRTIEGTAKGGGASVGLSGFWGGSTNFENEQNTPTGKAIRAAVIHISDYLDCVMVRKDDCKAQFDAEERHRRDKDTGALKLD
jgi:curli biogenesis system outer membrane secretion channel CsgG